MASPHGWTEFIIRSSRNAEGRRAFEAYRRQRAIAFTAPAKLDYVERLLHQHRRDRAIIFTQDNATVHLVARRFLLPAITHQTRVSERSEILDGLAKGRYNRHRHLQGTQRRRGCSRGQRGHRHVGQRLGARARATSGPHPAQTRRQAGHPVRAGCSGTSETFTSQRRREHIAYR